MIFLYQFPMGKVKAEYRYLIDSNESTYQFPMGKVKSTGTTSEWRRDTVSIPYGKGKDNGGMRMHARRPQQYQFPMGKVKGYHY